MDIGENGMPGIFDSGEDAQAFFESGTAKSGEAGSIGFIERCFEDEGSSNVADGIGHEMHVLLAFDDAGSGNQSDWPAAAERNGLSRWRRELNGM